ncbi:hypothetical protein [Levilactobacillus tujiorum]|uniref:Uncharacterized protein n=1 Tax=Levilactobacillus tujiorum TaxID=2912243 RepID=A0ABX1L7L6_9LACO|nr:hypothetical protein [Levilactobacillus tujiorum]MCH5465531.1 hypothetical protein [Levilactobacillus tujiorum]NLR12733.1 hypothetical protein [Lactobacillus sp. HBUAS51387]NLR30648.1 hypothetical protein [Levilactobacillus tujiorum]
MMKSVLRKSLLVLTVVGALNVPSVLASAATGDTENVQSYSQAAEEFGISENEFRNQTQKAAEKSAMRPASRANASRVHFEFRTFNPYDSTYRIPKQTKSAYFLKSNTVHRPWYSAEAYGHSYLAGGTGDVSVSGPRRGTEKVYKIYGNHNYKLTNYLVERYGYGNNAYILAWSRGDGNAWGYWHPDVKPW